MYTKSNRGYRIAEDFSGGRLLVQISDENGNPDYSYYHHLPSNLYRKFCQLKKSEEEIVNFANCYGELGIDELSKPAPAVAEDSDSGEPEWQGFEMLNSPIGEYIELWYYCRDEMRNVVNLSDALFARNEQRIEKLIVYEYNRYWYADDPRFSQAKYDRRTREHYAKQRCGIEKRLAAKDYIFFVLHQILNKGSMSFTIDKDEDYDLQITESPNGLYRGMWLQFARWYCQESEHITHEGMTCRREGCGIRFTAKSLKRIWCSDACRQAAYRQRNRKPKENLTKLDILTEKSTL